MTRPRRVSRSDRATPPRRTGTANAPATARRRPLPDPLFPLAILLVALAIRLSYTFGIRHTPPGELLLIDSETYDRLARSLLGGTLRGEEAYAMNLLYPYFLAGVYALAGAARLAALVAQAALDSATCLIVYVIGARLFDRTVAATAGALGVLCAPLVFYSGALLTPTLVTFLGAVALLALARYQKTPRAWLALAAGIGVGLATLGRGNHLLLVPLGGVVFGLAAPNRRAAVCHWAALALGALLVLAPMSARNYLVARQWVPVAANYAAFYIGHNPEATGLYAMPSFTESARFDSEVWGTRDAVARKLGRPVTLAESSRYLFGEGLRYALAHPLDELRLAARKLYFFWNRTEPPTNLNFYFARDFSPLLRGLPINFGIVGPLCLLGLWLSRREPKRFALLWVFVAASLLTALLFFVSAEYRLPVLPAALLLAAYALVWTVRAARARRPRALWPALAVLAAAAIFVNVRSPLLRAQSLKRVDYLNFGRLYLEKGEYGPARGLLEHSLAIDPNYAPAYQSLAELSARQGDGVAALRYATRARQLVPVTPPAARQMGSPTGGAVLPDAGGLTDRLLALGALYQAGRWEEARAGFEEIRAAAQSRGDTALALRMLNDIGLCRYKQRDLAGAEAAFTEILTRQPGYVKAYNNLGLVREAQGHPAEATTAYRQALRLEPGNAVAQRALARLSGAAPPTR